MPKAKNCLYNIIPHFREDTAEKIKKEFGLSEVYRLCANENPLGCSAAAVKAMGVAAAKGGIFPDDSCEDLTLALAEILGVSPGELFFATGRQGVVGDLISAYIDKGNEIIIPQPYLADFQSVATLFGGVCKGIPLNDDFIVDLPAMAAAISTSTKLIYIPNPADPTGTVINRRSLLQMLHRIGKDILVVLDEAYIQYVEYDDEDAAVDGLKFLREFPNIVVTRSFSHCYGLAGLALGFGVGAKDVVAQVGKVKRPYQVSAVAQAGALAAICHKEHLNKTLEFNKVERDILTLSLTAMGLEVTPSQANFILVHTPIKSQVVTKALLAKGIMVKSCEDFGFPQAIRVSVGLHKENEIFLAALKELLEK